MEDIPEDIQDKYKWVEGVSITHMEILHAAFRFVCSLFPHKSSQWQCSSQEAGGEIVLSR